MGLSDVGIQILESGIAELGLKMPTHAIDTTCRYLELIEAWNEKINLTRIIGDEAAKLHFLDALSIVRARSLSQEDLEYVADVGTGLGVPGIVLKIFFPEMKLLLVDSLKKRVTVLSDMIEKLSLRNVSAVHARAEELGLNPTYREQFSLVTARAVADLKILSELCLPLCKVGGVFAAYKGDISAHELTASHGIITKLGGDGFIESKRIKVPHLDAERTIVLISKKSQTPREYPRPYRVIEKG